jgi:cyclohexa-1,5-dienecarbonyl-CoA hydratase
MAKFAHIRFDQTDGIARLTLARPKHNVLSVEMMNEINTVLDALIADDEVKCLVIDAEGRSFCAGVDVGEHAPELAELTISTFGGIFERLDQLDIPVIAAVQGACLGGGMELAIACDIVCAGEAAVFGQPEVRLAFIPPYAAVRLPELVGPAKAIEICTTGRSYSAREACEMGFVGHVYADDALTQEVESFVSAIAASSPLIIRMNKRAVRNVLGKPFAEALAATNDYYLTTLLQTEDMLEGLASFEERRQPVWKNA